MRTALLVSLVLLAVAAGHASAGLAGAAAVRAAADPQCIRTYSSAPARARGRLELGIDPGLAGSAGGSQLPTVPDRPRLDLTALKALRPTGRRLVLRLNRLFWSAGEAGIDRFQRMASGFGQAGFKVEVQVRYHPPAGKAGDLRAWRAYVRQVVDAFGPDRAVIAMTITNEVNITFSSNTSDGAYKRARDALIQGIEAAHAEARAHGWRRLRFGFTYAYRFPQDADFFKYLGAHGGPAFRRALDFVGLDFYPGSVYPLTMGPRDSYRTEFAQAAGVLRDCFAVKAKIAAVPIWITENGVPTGRLTNAEQADALRQLVRAAHDYAGTFDITDYRWFNLRDSNSKSPAKLVGPTFTSDGLLRSDYTRKPSFGAYRKLIKSLGV